MLVGQALTALAREGDALGTPLVIWMADRPRPDELPGALDQCYQAWLESMQVMHHRVAEAATLRKDIVASPDLIRVSCRTPHQMALANALCRAWETRG